MKNPHLKISEKGIHEVVQDDKGGKNSVEDACKDEAPLKAADRHR